MGFIQRRLVRGVLWVVAWPKVTLGICALVLVASVIGAWWGLSLSTDENALLTPDLPFFKDYLRFDAKFPENEAFVVVVWPKDYSQRPLATRWIGLSEEIRRKLTDPAAEVHKDVDRVDTHAPLKELGEQALLFDDWADLKEQSGQVKEMVPLLKIVGQKPGGFFDPEAVVLGRNMTQRLLNALDQSGAARGKDFVALIAGSLNQALATPPEQWSNGREIPDLTDLDPNSKYDPSLHGYYLIPDESKRDDPAHKDDKILIVNVYENRDYSTLADVSEPLARMRAAVAEAAKAYPEFHVSITGRPALEADEMSTSDHDTRVAEILGLSLVFVVLWIFLKKLWLVIVAEVGLGVGIGWTFGWATLSTGRLNLLSLVFIIALIGIGMDYLIQILTRYRHEKMRYRRPQAIWSRVFRYVSPPISTACLGAAGAFFVSKLTNFAGAGELGVIAGGGLLLCLASGYTFIPAVLTLFPAKIDKVAEGERYEEKRQPRVARWRLIVPVVWVLVAAGGLFVALPPKFDPDLIKLQAQSLESVQLVHKLPAWYAVVMSESLEKLRAARAALSPHGGGEAEQTLIRNTDSVVDAMDKQAWLAKNNAALAAIKWAEPAPPTSGDLKEITDAASRLLTTWEKRKDAGDLSAVRKQIEMLMSTLHDPAKEGLCMDRIGKWQSAFVNSLHETVQKFIPPPLNLATLPKEVRDHYVSDLPDIAAPRSERPASTTKQAARTYALYAYPTQDLWATDHLEKFVNELEHRLSPTDQDVVLTGIAVQLFHSTEEIRHAFLLATIYALLLIIVLVFIDLRSFKETVLAVSVLGFGLPMLLLMMWAWRWLGEPFGIPGSWNFANFFGLPILIGAGHEYGVFMVHRYKEALHDPRRVWGRWDVSDRALLLCAIVTSFSFGFLMRAQHRGLASLGWVMAVGTGCVYVATVVVLRPILQWLLARREQKVTETKKTTQRGN
jgi:predicted RND superfamily exporter protein